MTTAIAKIIRDNESQRKRAKTLEKTQHKLLFDVFRNEGVSRRVIQSYVEKYVEIIYTQ